MSDTREPMQPSDFRERDRLEGNPSIPALNTQALAALERVYAAASGGDVYPLLVELVRGLMEDAERLTLSRNAWKDSARITAVRANTAEASLSALRERVAKMETALQKMAPMIQELTADDNAEVGGKAWKMWDVIFPLGVFPASPDADKSNG